MTLQIQATEPRSTEPHWCINADTRHNIIARRNSLAALWAGRLMGLSEAETTAYAVKVHFADFEVSGDADVVERIAGDLNARGLPIPESVVREKLAAFHREALLQTGVTD